MNNMKRIGHCGTGGEDRRGCRQCNAERRERQPSRRIVDFLHVVKLIRYSYLIDYYALYLVEVRLLQNRAQTVAFCYQIGLGLYM